ncbi:MULTISPECIES: ANTAR domain-containing protein [Pseudonocardiaceae]|uniref:AmiR/NasT family two-component response regulator n=1 Tax=Amycolatopsis roodepoortensis TaxID=700274 RepID=A0ABR9LFW9_9PSEU|nr:MULTISPECIES: ANTAR domain-containing protein [Pseudonocardiaceae]MBE1579549.1 AmiR/NasT family two-component response regulator [Amycolatopsis roodepoortensis]
MIEQAKKTLMLTYSIDNAVAWSLLRWQSQEHNVKVRELAA